MKTGLSRHPRRQRQADPALGWLAHVTFFGITLLAMGGVFLLLRPYLQPIIIGVLLAGVFAPLHRRVLSKCRGRANLASLISVCLVFLLVVVPLGLFATVLLRQAVGTAQAANEWIKEGKLQEAIQSEGVQRILSSEHVVRARELLSSKLGIDTLGDLTLENSHVGGMAMGAGEWLVKLLGERMMPALKTIVAATGNLLLKFMIMLFVMYFMFRDGSSILSYVQHLSPLTTRQENALIDRVRDVSRAVVTGTFVTALAQGIASMVAFWICDIPAFFWGTVLAAASIVPAVGTALVWVPATVYLLITGHVGLALFLVLWCTLVVGSIDNFLRPMLMGERVGMSSLVVFFAIMGGISTFGLMGIIYGPLVFGICAVCFYIYELENSTFLDRQDAG